MMNNIYKQLFYSVGDEAPITLTFRQLKELINESVKEYIDEQEQIKVDLQGLDSPKKEVEILT